MNEDMIIRQVLDGHTESFRHLVNAYKNRSYNLAYSIVKSELTAEEAVQDAFVKAFQNLRKFRQQASFSTWLYRIVVNESLRKGKKRTLETRDLSVSENDQEKHFSIQPEALKNLHAEEQKELIADILSSMKSTESLMLKLFYLEEKDIHEIEHITGLSVNYIKVLLHRGRKNFAGLYNQKLSIETGNNETGQHVW